MVSDVSDNQVNEEERETRPLAAMRVNGVGVSIGSRQPLERSLPEQPLITKLHLGVLHD